MWEIIEPHYRRGVVIYVRGLTLPEAGAAMALDDVATVEQWLNRGILRRPTPADAEHWARVEAVFDMLVIQPWVLIADRPD